MSLFHQSTAMTDSLGRAVLFASKLPTRSSPRAHPRRDCFIKSALPDAAVSMYNGLSANMQENILRLHSASLQKTSELGLSLPSQEYASWWWWAFLAPMTLSYLFATPGSLAGLADFIYAPIHAGSLRSFSAEDVEIGRQLGEGSFGVVYEGFFGRDKSKKGSNSDGLHVVLKKAKTRVKGASEIHNSEIHMNYRLQRSASLACAEFLGIMQVRPTHAHGKLSEGVWLVWNFQGDRSLDHYLKQKNFPEILLPIIFGKKAQSASKSEILKWNAAATKEIFKQILINLQDLHKTGVVHRDVKPLNLILDQNSRKFKFIDFGACVDLRSGFNYVPNETVIDPTYAAPEHYVMPTSTPKLPPDPLCSLISPFFWHLNTPDRFDLYSAGLILMQLSMKSLRHDTGIQGFNTELKRKGYDLKKWRATCRHGKEEFAVLDADGGAGWELVTALLQPRHDKDHFIWPSLGSSRPSASAALRHRFFKNSFPSPKIFCKELPDLTPRVLPSIEVFAQSMTRAVKQLGNHSNKDMGKTNRTDKTKMKTPLFPSVPSLRPVLNAVSLNKKNSGQEDAKKSNAEQVIGTSPSVSLNLASLTNLHTLPSTTMVRENVNNVLQGVFKMRPQNIPTGEAELLRNQEMDLKMKRGVGQSSSGDTMKRETAGFSPIGATLPTVTASAVAFAAGWLAFSGLNSSAQASYEFGKVLMSTSGISGSAFLAFFLVIKPWLEEQGFSHGKDEKSKSLMVNEVEEEIYEDTSLAKDEHDSKALAVRDFHAKMALEKYQSIHFEDSAMQVVVETLQELDMHMSVLERLMLEEQQGSQRQKELVQRLESLLLDPSTNKSSSKSC